MRCDAFTISSTLTSDLLYALEKILEAGKKGNLNLITSHPPHSLVLAFCDRAAAGGDQGLRTLKWSLCQKINCLAQWEDQNGRKELRFRALIGWTICGVETDDQKRAGAPGLFGHGTLDNVRACFSFI